MKKQSGSPAGEAGQTLLEVLLAFSVSIMVLSAVIIGITTSLSNAQYTKNQNLANSYVQEGMAVVRQARDSSGNNFISSYPSNAYCLGQNPMELKTLTAPNCWAQSPVPAAGGIFSREIVLEHNSSKCCSNDVVNCAGGIKGSSATVKVSWTDNKCPAGAATPFCHSVELITCFSTIDPTPTP